MNRFVIVLSSVFITLGFLLVVSVSNIQRNTVLAQLQSECISLFTWENGKFGIIECQTEIPVPTNTAVIPTETSVPTDVPTATNTVRPSRTPTEQITATSTVGPTLTSTATLVPTDTPIPTNTVVANIQPYPNAPLCPDSGANHDNTVFHTLWDSSRGCHYDHEHGYTPFTAAVNSMFPEFNLQALLGGVQIGHTNPSSPAENTIKHGGFKWDVRLQNYQGCKGRENIATGIDVFVVQYHGFGNYAVEFETRTHSAVAMMRQCQLGNPEDKGYVFVNWLQDYGQRTAPYQGEILQYPDTPLPAYAPEREPYFSVTCFGGAIGTKCAKFASRDAMVVSNNDAETTWISEPVNITQPGPNLLSILFRARDTYQALDASDMVYPFTFAWLCSSDNGASYNGATANCRWNNTTTRVHEVIGNVPNTWDNLSGFDTNPTVGRVTGEGYVTPDGQLMGFCNPQFECFPIKLVNAFVGKYGTGLGIIPEKTPAFDPQNLAERDIYFCNGVQCSEFSPNAVPSGWLGENN